MDISRWRRGVGTLAAVAAIAASATYAHAQSEISLSTITPAGAPGSDAVVRIVDNANPGNEVTHFQFNVFYDSSETSPTMAAGVPGETDNGDGVGITGPFSTPAGDQLAAGLDKYVTVDGSNSVANWTNRGPLADVTFTTLPGYSGSLKLDIAESPIGQSWGYGYIDSGNNVYDNSVTYGTGITTSYGSPVIASIDHEGTWLGTGDTVTVTGSGFFDDGAGPAPDTVFTYNGQTLAATINSQTEAVVTIPVFTALPGAATEYADLDLTASNGSGYTDDDITYTLVSQDKVYVDDDWGSFADHKRISTGKIAGGNAFANIQPAVNAVNVGQTVEVAGGTYAENNSAAEALLINKALSLVGPNIGVDGNDGRSAEALIVPAVQLNNDQEWSDIPVVNITSSNVTIDGFSISGDNANFDGFDYAGMNLEAGTAVQSAASNVSFVNNIVSDASFLGFFSTNGDSVSAPGHHNVFVTNNLFEDITDNNTLGYGMAVYMQASTGKVNDNTFRDVRQAMQIQPYRIVADFGNGEAAEVIGNDMEAWRGGIYYNYAEVGASPWTFSNNVIAACEPPSTFAGTSVLWEGITIETMRDTGNGGTIDNNIIDGTTAQADASHDNVGVFDEAVWGIRYKGAGSLSDDVVISNNNVSNVTLGFVHDAPSTVTLIGNTFANFTDDAIRLQLTYGSTGVATLNGSSETFGGTGNVDATGGNTYAAVDSAGANLDELFAIEDVITHKVDDLAWGLVRVVPENIFVTQESNSIQRGVDAATGGDTVYAGDTIHVQTGTYAEAKEIDTDEYIGLDVYKQVALLGPNAGVSPNVGVRVGEAVIIPGARLNAAAVAGSGYNRITNWHPVVSLSAASTVFDGFSVTGINGDLTDAEGPANIGGLALSAGTGILSEADGVKIENNIVDGFSYVALWSAGYWAPSHFDDITIANNLVQNVHSNAGYGYAYYIGGSSGDILNNYAVNVRSAMNIQPYDNDGTVANCSGNVLNGWALGLWYNYSQGNATPWAFTDNHVTAGAMPTMDYTPSPTYDVAWRGIVTQTQYASGPGGSFSGNTVDADGASLPTTGIHVRSTIPTPTDALVFELNEVQNADTGVAITFENTATFNGQATFQNNNEIHNNVVGVDIAGTSNLPQIINGNNIHDNEIGIRVRNGGIASINGNTLTGNAQQLAFEVSAANEAVVNTFNMQNLLAGNLEAVVAANTVTGKTYISAGMADTQGAVVAESVGGEQFTFVRNTIQGSVSAPANIAAGDTVKVLPDSYRENVTLGVGTPVRLSGSGPGVTTIVGPHDGTRRAVYIRSASIVEGFTLTRDGNNATDWLTNTLSETVTIGSGASNAIVQDNIIADGRSGVYIEGANTGNIVRRNLITHNHTGMHLVDRQIGLLIENNTIVDNRTGGILFRGTGTGQTSNVTIVDNNISGNWLGQIINRYAYSDVINASGNWLGSTELVAQDQERLESGTQLDPPYNTSMPTYYTGGTYAAPGNPIAISGAEHELVDFNAYLASATDDNASPLAFEGDFSTLYLVPSALANGEDSHISDAVALLADGTLTGAARLINVNEGIYEDGVANVDKSVQIVGIGDRALTVFNPKAAGQNGIEIAASNVAIDNLTIAGDNATRYGTAIYRPNTGAYGNTTLNNLAVSYAGDFSTKKYAVDLRQPIAGSNLVSTVSGVTFDNCGYAGLALFGGDVDVTGSSFTNMSYQGIYAAPAHATPGSTLSGGAAPVVTAKNNSFTGTPVSIRLNNVGAGSVIGGATADANTFNVAGAASPGYGMGVSIEGAPAAVSGNQFNLSTDTSTGVWVWDTAATVSGNTFTGSGGTVATGIAAVGLRTGDLAGSGRNYSDATNVTATGNTFTGLSAGIVANEAADATQAVAITVNASNTFEDNHDGVLVDGEFATAAVNSNTFTNNDHGIDIAAATDASDFDSNTFGAIGTSAQKYIVNNSGHEFFVGGNSFDGATPTSLNLETEVASIWAILGGLVDELDIADGAGYLRLVNDFVFVPEAKDGDKDDAGLIQRAFNVATAGDDVALEPGDFTSGGTTNGATADKLLTVETASLTERATVHHGIAFAVPDAAGNVGISNVNFTDAGAVMVGSATLGTSVQTQATIGIKNLKFEGLTGTSLPTAIGVLFLDPTGDALEIDNIVITDSTLLSGISLMETRNAEITSCSITNNIGSGISIVKAQPDPGAITPSGISITDCTISGNGVVGTDYADWNNEAYGVLVASVGTDAELPFGQNISLTGNIITNNAATGVFLSGQDGATITGNVIESNGLFEIDQNYGSQNNDGLKINTSKNTTVTDNYIRFNGRNNVLVSAKTTDDPTDTENIQITFNHLEGNVEHPDGIGAALMLQLYNSPSDTVVATDNWWGHVYGPSEDVLNPTGRGGEVDLQGGTVDISNWYGIQDETNKWYQLNDQDGDGVWDADEDVSLTYDLTPGETGLAVKDSDGDGYEDGAEVKLGSDPLDGLSTPADPNGDGNTDDTHVWATFANLTTGNTDSDEDGYLDFYEVGQGTDPTDDNSAPSLGLLKPSAGLNIAQVSVLRRILVGTLEFTDPEIEQDDGDVNRDGVVNNADLIFLRRFAAGTNPTLPIVPTMVHPE